MFDVHIRGDHAPSDRPISIADLSTGVESLWHIPNEVPTAFVYNRRNYAVMLATPADLVDYVVGFSLTERVINSVADIKSLEVHHSDKGIDFRIKIDQNRIDKLDVVQRRRNLVGSASCGLCGLENADSLFEVLPRHETKLSLRAEAVLKAIHEVSDHQPINGRTRSVHGAAWVSLGGDIQLLREDVGRHNALDKLIGALALSGADCSDGFVLMSSRCSYELIEKAARRGIRALVSISGPTDFALTKARQANIAVYTRSPSGAVELIG